VLVDGSSFRGPGSVKATIEAVTEQGTRLQVSSENEMALIYLWETVET